MSSGRIAFRNAQIVDGTGGASYEGTVVVEHGRIAAVGPGDLAADGNARVVDASAWCILPGLIDAHVHLALNGGPESSSAVESEDSFAVLRFAADMERTLRAGFTAVRDLGGRNYIEMSLRDAIERGIATGPRLRLCGKIVSMTTPGTEFYPGMYREADGADEVRKAAREQLKHGADVVKLMATGAGFAPGEDPKATQYSEAELRAAIEEAHKQGRTAAAHAEGIDGIRNAVNAGIDTIEHGDYLCEDESVAHAMAERGTTLVPTMNLYDAILQSPEQGTVPEFIIANVRALRDANRQSFQLALELGVPIALGTDGGTAFNRHGDNARELQLMVAAGMTPAQAIHAATGAAASALDVFGETGTLEPGKSADLLVVDQDPTADIDILTKPDRFALVMKGGAAIAGSDALLEELQARPASSGAR